LPENRIIKLNDEKIRIRNILWTQNLSY
jgi:hypothetical protein